MLRFLSILKFFVYHVFRIVDHFHSSQLPLPEHVFIPFRFRRVLCSLLGMHFHAHVRLALQTLIHVDNSMNGKRRISLDQRTRLNTFQSDTLWWTVWLCQHWHHLDCERLKFAREFQWKSSEDAKTDVELRVLELNFRVLASALWQCDERERCSMCHFSWDNLVCQVSKYSTFSRTHSQLQDAR
jgi:hypothetical protein